MNQDYLKKLVHGDGKDRITKEKIKEWIDANVYDGEAVRDQSDKVIFRGDQLQELVIEMYDDLTMLNLGDMDNVEIGRASCRERV